MTPVLSWKSPGTETPKRSSSVCQTLASGADFETCVENIDIGGPAMLRAAAKNHASVAVVV